MEYNEFALDERDVNNNSNGQEIHNKAAMEVLARLNITDEGHVVCK